MVLNPEGSQKIFRLLNLNIFAPKPRIQRKGKLKVLPTPIKSKNFRDEMISFQYKLMILFLKVGERQTSKKSSIQEERQLFIELESELWTMGLLRHLSKPMFVNHYFILHLLGFVLDIVFTIKKLFFPQRTTELGSKINVCFK